MDPHSVIAAAEAIYLDASALVKLAKLEPDTDHHQSRAVAVLTKGGTIPLYTSLVGFGETLGVWGKKRVQKSMGIGLYIFGVRGLLVDLKMGRIKQVEPSDDPQLFNADAERVLGRSRKIGGGDLWHLLSVIELRRGGAGVCFLSYDRKLVKAAAAEGLTAVNGKHLDPDRLFTALKNAGNYVGVG